MRCPDYHSLRRILKLHPAIRSAALELLLNCIDEKIPIRITQGMRTLEEQDILYAQGRTTPGPEVTKAPAGKSYHNYGLAIDFCLLISETGEVLWDREKDFNANGVSDWAEIIKIAKKLGFKSGADWEEPDAPHLYMQFGLSVQECKNLMNDGYMSPDGFITLEESF